MYVQRILHVLHMLAICRRDSPPTRSAQRCVDSRRPSPTRPSRSSSTRPRGSGSRHRRPARAVLLPTMLWFSDSELAQPGRRKACGGMRRGALSSGSMEQAAHAEPAAWHLDSDHWQSDPSQTTATGYSGWMIHTCRSLSSGSSLRQSI